MWRVDKIRGAQLATVFLCAMGVLLSSAESAWAQWPEPAVRSGTFIPKERKLAVALQATGMYVPKLDQLSMGETGIVEGGLVWNFGLSKRLGLIGKHTLAGIRWGNVTALTLGHEAGLRFRGGRYFVVEAAYLSHRHEQEWIESADGEVVPWAVANVRDRGMEIGSWLRFDLFDRLRIEAHIMSRVFRLYKRTQGVTGVGLRTSILLVDGQSVVTELEILRVVRNDPRPGVEVTTWNFLGSALWRLSVSRRFGIQIGARASTSMLSGEVPMFEIKRSTINEKMVLVLAGINFFV
jgi:hypothetical protein